MENAAEGLKYAFAIMVFVIAISIAFMSISQARATSDIITYALDKTNYYPQLTRTPNGSNWDLQENHNSVMTVDASGNRVVGVDTVISSLYRYYTEGFCVIINAKDGSRIAKFDSYTDSVSRPPWNVSTQAHITRIDAFLSGNLPYSINGNKVGFGGTSGEYTGSGNSGYWSIAEQPFNTYINSNTTFIENFVEVNTSGTVLTAPDGSSIQLTSAPVIQKVYITYTATK